MAVVIEIDESNAVAAAESITHAVASLLAGSTDSPTAKAPIVAGNNSFEKWTRVHVSDLGGATAIDTFKVWAQAPPAEHTFGWNGAESQVTYDSANHKQTTWAAPATTTTRTPETLPTSQPAGANLGIGGSLTGQLIAVGFSDYALLQVRPTALALAGSTVLVSYGYQVVA